ncbi:MAG TPA: hypothetical protein VK440_02755 [Burkholderiales bacterium]|nr:hypothetical protein [Burkholderiales bacterium]
MTTGHAGTLTGRAIGTFRAAGFFLGAARLGAGFFFAAFFRAGAAFLRAAGFLAGAFFRFALAFAFFLVAI